MLVGHYYYYYYYYYYCVIIIIIIIIIIITIIKYPNLGSFRFVLESLNQIMELICLPLLD